MLSPGGLETLLRLLVSEPRARVSRAVIDGNTLWIKRYDVEPTPLAKFAHAALSPLLPRYMRASPKVDRKGFINRELRKMSAFRAAGFAVTDLVFCNDRVLVLSDAAQIVQQRLAQLRGTDAAAHDRLLVGAADALGMVHAAGLCHGRPHPRDMFSNGSGHWGFIDFEEEPEAVMPLALAQARDVWLLFLQISSQALKPETQALAFAAYRGVAPEGVIEPLRRVVRFFSVVTWPLRLLPVSILGKDARNMLKATAFLKAALDGAGPSADQDILTVPATGSERPRG